MNYNETGLAAIYLVKLWARDAITGACRRAWDGCREGEDYYTGMNRIAYEIATHPDYPLCEDLEHYWHRLHEAQTTEHNKV